MATVDVIMPQMGESITEGTLVKWLKNAGDAVKRDEPLFEISTEKVDVEIPAPASGVLVAVKVKEGETVPVNTVVAVIEKDGAGAVAAAPAAPVAPVAAATATVSVAPSAAVVSAPAAPVVPAESATAGEKQRIRSSPLVRRIAREHGIELTGIAGTGIAGRITRTDIEGHLAQAGSAPAAGQRAAPVAAQAQATALKPLAGRVEPLSTMRKKIAEHMIHSRRTSAHVQTVFELDMSQVVKLREQHGAFQRMFVLIQSPFENDVTQLLETGRNIPAQPPFKFFQIVFAPPGLGARRDDDGYGHLNRIASSLTVIRKREGIRQRFVPGPFRDNAPILAFQLPNETAIFQSIGSLEDQMIRDGFDIRKLALGNPIITGMSFVGRFAKTAN